MADRFNCRGGMSFEAVIDKDIGSLALLESSLGHFEQCGSDRLIGFAHFLVRFELFHSLIVRSSAFEQ